MLVGHCNFLDEHYKLTGSDLSDIFYFDFEAIAQSGVDMFDGYEDSAGSNYRRVQVNTSTCKSEIQNWEFALCFAATMRYAKSHCYNIYLDGYMGEQMESGEFQPETEFLYNIPNIGKVVLSMGFVKKCSIKTPFIEIELDSDDGLEPTIFKKFDAKSKGFSFTYEYLGFSIEERIKESTPMGLYTSLDQIRRNNPTKDYSWLQTRKYVIVDDNNLEEICTKFLNTNKLIAYDTETSGLAITFRSRVGQDAQLVGVVLSDTIGEGYYFPLQHKNIKNLCNGDHHYVMERYLKPILETKELIAHNSSFDWKVAYIYGINANIVHDTQLIFKLTYGQKYLDFSTNLKGLVKQFLNKDMLELHDFVQDNSWGDSDIKFWDLPYELVRLYAPTDSDMTLSIYEYAKSLDLIHSFNQGKIYDIEVIFAKVVGYQEFYGHKVAVDRIPELSKLTEEALADLKQKMVEIVGYDFNPASSVQLKRIMYEELGIPTQYKTKKGKTSVSTDKDALAELMTHQDVNGKCIYPFVELLKEYRGHEGTKKNFLNKLNEVSDNKCIPICSKDGFIHSDVYQLGTETGRCSIKETNYQSYNKLVKKFIIPREGFGMTDCDFGAIEYRTLASVAGQTNLIVAFDDPELDYHSYQAARMFNTPYESVTPELRSQSKGINFGLPYGMGDKSLGKRVFGSFSDENTRKAALLRKKYFTGQEKIEHFFKVVREQGVANGYTSTYYGRRRYYHRNLFSRAEIERQAGNHVIQGTAADIYKIAVGRIFLRICQEGLLGKVLLPAFVHDETLFEVHKSINPFWWLKVVKEEFEVAIQGFCKLYIGFGFGTSWYQAKSVELPVGLQNELVAKYADSYNEWDGDYSKLCKNIDNFIIEYKTRCVKDFILDKDHQGKTIKPTINSYLYEILVEDYASENKIELKKAQKKYKGVKLQDALDEFCKNYELNRQEVNILSSEEATGASLDDPSTPSDMSLDSDEDIEAQYQFYKLERIKEYGLYLDVNKGEVTLNLVHNKGFMEVVRNKVNKGGDGYKLFLIDLDTNTLMTTPSYLTSQAVADVQKLYLNFFASVGR